MSELKDLIANVILKKNQKQATSGIDGNPVKYLSGNHPAQPVNDTPQTGNGWSQVLQPPKQNVPDVAAPPLLPSQGGKWSDFLALDVPSMIQKENNLQAGAAQNLPNVGANNPPVDNSQNLPSVGAAVIRNNANNTAPNIAEQNLPSVRSRFAGILPNSPPVDNTQNLPSVSAPMTNVPSTSTRQRVVNYQDLSQDDQINQDVRRKNELMANGAQKEGLGKRLLNGALDGLSHWNGQGGVGGLIGSVAGGAAVDGISPKADSRQRANREIGQINQRLQSNIGLQNEQLNQRMKQTQIDDRIHDNNAADQKEKDARDMAQGKQQDSRRAAWFKTRKFFDPAKATDADRREAASFGETPESIGKYDFTNPQVRESGGIKYRLNPNTGAWEDSGIPKDGSKAIVDYTVTDPQTGVESTYSTTSENAARLKNSLATSGMQINAAKERQQSQQSFQAGQNRDNRQSAGERVDKQIGAANERQKTQLLNSSLSRWQQQYSKTHFKEPSQEEIDQATQNLRKTIYGQ